MNYEQLKHSTIETAQTIQHRVADRMAEDRALRKASVNVGNVDRVASGVLGSALVLLGLRRPGLTNRLVSLVGADLVLRAACGHCNIYKALNFSTLSKAQKEAIKAASEPRLARRPAA
ncbi:MAG: hypothetical protein RIQ81_793 [Pseudomonadota bacterium]|jgi:uncharacterized membrane protein